MASELIGTIHQYINRCKDTIVEWCKDAAKTVCLPLTGGTINGDINITGKINNKSANVMHPEEKVEYTQLEGNMGANDFWRLAVGVSYPGTSENDSGSSYLSIDISDDNNEQLLVRRYTGTNTWLETNIKKTLTLLDPTGNSIFPGSITATSVLTTGDSTSKTQAVTDNSTKIATTAWVNNFLNAVSSESVKWQKAEVTASAATSTKPQGAVNQTCVRLREGLQICFGLVSNAKPNYLVTFAKPFINGEYAVTATLHYGGNESGDGLVGHRAHEDSSVHVYQTTATSFRLGRDMFYADYNSWINQGVDIGLGWVEWIAVGWWKR